MSGAAIAMELYHRWFPSNEAKLDGAMKALGVYRELFPNDPITDQAALGKVNELIKNVAGFELPKVGANEPTERTGFSAQPRNPFGPDGKEQDFVPQSLIDADANERLAQQGVEKSYRTTPYSAVPDSHLKPGQDSPYTEALMKSGRLPQRGDVLPILPPKQGVALIGEDGTVKTVDVPKGYAGHMIPKKSMFQHITEGMDETGQPVYAGVNQSGEMTPLPGKIRPIVKKEKPESEFSEPYKDEQGNLFQKEKHTNKIYPIGTAKVNEDRDRNGRTLELVLGKMARDEELTPGEQNVLNTMKPQDQAVLNSTFNILRNDDYYVNEKDAEKRKARAIQTFNEQDDIAKMARGQKGSGEVRKPRYLREAIDPATKKKVGYNAATKTWEPIQ